MDLFKGTCQEFAKVFGNDLASMDNIDDKVQHHAEALTSCLKLVLSIPDSPSVQKLWGWIIRSSVTTLLHLSNQPSPRSLQLFIENIKPWLVDGNFMGLCHNQLKDMYNLAIKGPWSQPVLQRLISGDTVSFQELQEVFDQGLEFVEYRLRSLHMSSKMEQLLIFGTAALRHPVIQKNKTVQKIYQSCANHLLSEEDLIKQIENFDLNVTITLIEELLGESTNCEKLCTAVIKFLWQRKQMEHLEEATACWIKLLHKKYTETELFDYLARTVIVEETSSQSVQQCVALVSALWKVVGEPSRMICVEILCHALQLLSSDDQNAEQLKKGILSSIAYFLPNSQVSRLCLLAIFIQDPTLDHFFELAKTYKVPYNRDKDTAVNCKAHMRLNLLEYLQQQRPPQFRHGGNSDWPRLRTVCYEIMTSDDALYARQVEEEEERKELEAHLQEEATTSLCKINIPSTSSESNETSTDTSKVDMSDTESSRNSTSDSCDCAACKIKQDQCKSRSNNVEVQECPSQKIVKPAQSGKLTAVVRQGANLEKNSSAQDESFLICPEESCRRAIRSKKGMSRHLSATHSWSSPALRVFYMSMENKTSKPRQAKSGAIAESSGDAVCDKTSANTPAPPVVPPVASLAGSPGSEHVAAVTITTVQSPSEDKKSFTEDENFTKIQEELNAKEEYNKTSLTNPEPYLVDSANFMNSKSTGLPVLPLIFPTEPILEEKPTEKVESPIKEYEIKCPVSSCSRVFRHRHTVQAHIEFRHNIKPNKAAKMAKSAKLVDNASSSGQSTKAEAAETSTDKAANETFRQHLDSDSSVCDSFESNISVQRGWYWPFDDFTFEDLDDNVEARSITQNAKTNLKSSLARSVVSTLGSAPLSYDLTHAEADILKNWKFGENFTNTRNERVRSSEEKEITQNVEPIIKPDNLSVLEFNQSKGEPDPPVSKPQAVTRDLMDVKSIASVTVNLKHVTTVSYSENQTFANTTNAASVADFHHSSSSSSDLSSNTSSNIFDIFPGKKDKRCQTSFKSVGPNFSKIDHYHNLPEVKIRNYKKLKKRNAISGTIFSGAYIGNPSRTLACQCCMSENKLACVRKGKVNVKPKIADNDVSPAERRPSYSVSDSDEPLRSVPQTVKRKYDVQSIYNLAEKYQDIQYDSSVVGESSNSSNKHSFEDALNYVSSSILQNSEKMKSKRTNSSSKSQVNEVKAVTPTVSENLYEEHASLLQKKQRQQKKHKLNRTRSQGPQPVKKLRVSDAALEEKKDDVAKSMPCDYEELLKQAEELNASGAKSKPSKTPKLYPNLQKDDADISAVICAKSTITQRADSMKSCENMNNESFSNQRKTQIKPEITVASPPNDKQEDSVKIQKRTAKNASNKRTIDLRRLSSTSKPPSQPTADGHPRNNTDSMSSDHDSTDLATKNDNRVDTTSSSPATSSDVLCPECNKPMSCAFALMCHMRKRHKTHSKKIYFPGQSIDTSVSVAAADNNNNSSKPTKRSKNVLEPPEDIEASSDPASFRLAPNQSNASVSSDSVFEDGSKCTFDDYYADVSSCADQFDAANDEMNTDANLHPPLLSSTPAVDISPPADDISVIEGTAATSESAKVSHIDMALIATSTPVQPQKTSLSNSVEPNTSNIKPQPCQLEITEQLSDDHAPASTISDASNSNAAITKPLDKEDSIHYILQLEDGCFLCPFDSCHYKYKHKPSVFRHCKKMHAEYYPNIRVKAWSAQKNDSAKPDTDCVASTDVADDNPPHSVKSEAGRSARRMAYTEANLQIQFNSASVSKRKWTDLQELSHLYNKRMRRKIAQSLAPAKKYNRDLMKLTKKRKRKQSGDSTDSYEADYDAQLPCWGCDAMFHRRTNLTAHIQSHLRNIDLFKFRCDRLACLYAFRTEEELSLHKAKHKKMKCHICLFCPNQCQSFESIRKLCIHEYLKHSDIKINMNRLRKNVCLTTIKNAINPEKYVTREIDSSQACDESMMPFLVGGHRRTETKTVKYCDFCDATKQNRTPSVAKCCCNDPLAREAFEVLDALLWSVEEFHKLHSDDLTDNTPVSVANSITCVQQNVCSEKDIGNLKDSSTSNIVNKQVSANTQAVLSIQGKAHDECVPSDMVASANNSECSFNAGAKETSENQNCSIEQNEENTCTANTVSSAEMSNLVSDNAMITNEDNLMISNMPISDMITEVSTDSPSLLKESSVDIIRDENDADNFPLRNPKLFSNLETEYSLLAETSTEDTMPLFTDDQSSESCESDLCSVDLASIEESLFCPSHPVECSDNDNVTLVVANVVHKLVCDVQIEEQAEYMRACRMVPTGVMYFKESDSPGKCGASLSVYGYNFETLLSFRAASNFPPTISTKSAINSMNDAFSQNCNIPSLKQTGDSGTKIIELGENDEHLAELPIAASNDSDSTEDHDRVYVASSYSDTALSLMDPESMEIYGKLIMLSHLSLECSQIWTLDSDESYSDLCDISEVLPECRKLFCRHFVVPKPNILFSSIPDSGICVPYPVMSDDARLAAFNSFYDNVPTVPRDMWDDSILSTDLTNHEASSHTSEVSSSSSHSASSIAISVALPVIINVQSNEKCANEPANLDEEPLAFDDSKAGADGFTGPSTHPVQIDIDQHENETKVPCSIAPPLPSHENLSSKLSVEVPGKNAAAETNNVTTEEVSLDTGARKNTDDVIEEADNNLFFDESIMNFHEELNNKKLNRKPASIFNSRGRHQTSFDMPNRLAHSQRSMSEIVAFCEGGIKEADVKAFIAKHKHRFTLDGKEVRNKPEKRSLKEFNKKTPKKNLGNKAVVTKLRRRKTTSLRDGIQSIENIQSNGVSELFALPPTRQLVPVVQRLGSSVALKHKSRKLEKIKSSLKKTKIIQGQKRQNKIKILKNQTAKFAKKRLQRAKRTKSKNFNDIEPVTKISPASKITECSVSLPMLNDVVDKENNESFSVKADSAPFAIKCIDPSELMPVIHHDHCYIVKPLSSSSSAVAASSGVISSKDSFASLKSHCDKALPLDNVSISHFTNDSIANAMQDKVKINLLKSADNSFQKNSSTAQESSAKLMPLKLNIKPLSKFTTINIEDLQDSDISLHGSKITHPEVTESIYTSTDTIVRTEKPTAPVGNKDHFKCSVCLVEYNSISECIRHLSSEHINAKKPNHCKCAETDCLLSFDGEKELVEDETCHDDSYPVNCISCSSNSSNKFKEHLETHKHIHWDAQTTNQIIPASQTCVSGKNICAVKDNASQIDQSVDEEPVLSLPVKFRNEETKRQTDVIQTETLLSTVDEKLSLITANHLTEPHLIQYLTDAHSVGVNRKNPSNLRIQQTNLSESSSSISSVTFSSSPHSTVSFFDHPYNPVASSPMQDVNSSLHYINSNLPVLTNRITKVVPISFKTSSMSNKGRMSWTVSSTKKDKDMTHSTNLQPTPKLLTTGTSHKPRVSSTLFGSSFQFSNSSVDTMRAVMKENVRETLPLSFQNLSIANTRAPVNSTFSVPLQPNRLSSAHLSTSMTTHCNDISSAQNGLLTNEFLSLNINKTPTQAPVKCSILVPVVTRQSNENLPSAVSLVQSKPEDAHLVQTYITAPLVEVKPVQLAKQNSNVLMSQPLTSLSSIAVLPSLADKLPTILKCSFAESASASSLFTRKETTKRAPVALTTKNKQMLYQHTPTVTTIAPPCQVAWSLPQSTTSLRDGNDNYDTLTVTSSDFQTNYISSDSECFPDPFASPLWRLEVHGDIASCLVDEEDHYFHDTQPSMVCQQSYSDHLIGSKQTKTHSLHTDLPFADSSLARATFSRGNNYHAMHTASEVQQDRNTCFLQRLQFSKNYRSATTASSVPGFSKKSQIPTKKKHSFSLDKIHLTKERTTSLQAKKRKRRNFVPEIEDLTPSKIKSCKCRICKVYCLDLFDCRRHMLYRHGVYTCKFSRCYKYFKSTENLRIHYEVVHSTALSVIGPNQFGYDERPVVNESDIESDYSDSTDHLRYNSDYYDQRNRFKAKLIWTRPSSKKAKVESSKLFTDKTSLSDEKLLILIFYQVKDYCKSLDISQSASYKCPVAKCIVTGRKRNMYFHILDFHSLDEVICWLEKRQKTILSTHTKTKSHSLSSHRNTLKARKKPVVTLECLTVSDNEATSRTTELCDNSSADESVTSNKNKLTSTLATRRIFRCRFRDCRKTFRGQRRFRAHMLIHSPSRERWYEEDGTMWPIFKSVVSVSRCKSVSAVTRSETSSSDTQLLKVSLRDVFKPSCKPDIEVSGLSQGETLCQQTCLPPSVVPRVVLKKLFAKSDSPPNDE